MDSTAINYDPLATHPIASCQYENEELIYGCTNPQASNYDRQATKDDGSCAFSIDTINVVFGCTDPAANNYNPAANRYDNTCTYDTIFIDCTDIKATNYDNSATIDDGSCLYEVTVPGCTDVSAQNYNALATTNDGNCKYEVIIWGCRDNKATNYNVNATKDDGYCEYAVEIKACTDKTAQNYVHFATVDDGSCIYPEPESEVVVVYGCTDKHALNYNQYATNDNNFCIYRLIREEISGCTDEAAINYNPVATVSATDICVYVYGCIDSKALNYNANATLDDKSCAYARPINSYVPEIEENLTDTVATKPVSACDLNSNLPIDSAKIVLVELSGRNLIKASWVVYQGDNEIPFETEYTISQNGNTLFYLSIVCKETSSDGSVLRAQQSATTVVGFTVAFQYNVENFGATATWPLPMEEDLASKINVHPNPFSEVLNIHIDNSAEKVTAIELYSMEGLLQIVSTNMN